MLLLERLDLAAIGQDDLREVRPYAGAQLGEVRGRARKAMVCYLRR